ncbi:MAG TPA: hypothetical protein VED17_05795 [Nitrososphaerales archaeon]|nr:hypothetical protein [Nitrososphaerales archaeon]
MSRVQLTEQEERHSPSVFYFLSYGRKIGEAKNLKELVGEMRRLEYEDPAALRYHLKEGHIVCWLRSINEAELAEELDGVGNISLAQRLVEEYLERTLTLDRMRHGRMH